MEIMNTSLGGDGKFQMSRTNFLQFAAVTLCLAVSACSSAKKRDHGTVPGVGKEEKTAGAPETPTSAPEVAGPPESYGPEVPETPINTKQSLRVVFTQNNPGSFALAGVLSQLEHEKFAVEQITTSGLGAWISVLYGFSKTSNDFEFALMKISDQSFLNLSEAKHQLDQWGKKDLSESRISLEICAIDEKSKQPRFVNSGLASDWIFNSLKNPCTPDQIKNAGPAKTELKAVNVEMSASASPKAGQLVVDSKGAARMKRTDWVFRGKKSVTSQKGNLQ